MNTPDISLALKSLVEKEYCNIRINNEPIGLSFMYSLASVLNISTNDRERYFTMLMVCLQSMDDASRTAFIEKYSVPGEVIKKLNYSFNWPDTVSNYLEPLLGLTEAQLLAQRQSETLLQINRLRDTKIDNGFTWRGNIYQSRPSDRENVIGAAIAAQIAIAQGAPRGYYRWANPNSDFLWITADNQLVRLDAYDVLSLYQQGASFKTGLTFYARHLKDHVLTFTTIAEFNLFNPDAGWPS